LLPPARHPLAKAKSAAQCAGQCVYVCVVRSNACRVVSHPPRHPQQHGWSMPVLVLVPPGAVAGAAHCSTLLCLCSSASTRQPMQAGGSAATYVYETQEGLQCSRQLFVVCVPPMAGFVVGTENSCAQDRDRRCACIELLTLVACAAWCWLLSQAGYPVVAGGIRAGLPVPLLVDSCSVCCVVETGGGPPRGQLANSCVRPAVPFALQLCAPSAAF
jgi:hypothetical protein